MPYLLLTLTSLFWSVNFVLSRGLHTEIPPLALSFWRWLAALLLLCCFALPHFLRQRSLCLGNFRFLLMQGLLGVTGFNTLLYLAVQHTTAINAVLVNSCTPVLIIAISWLLHGDTITLRQGGGILLSLLGVLLILARGEPAALTQIAFNQGDLLVLAAAGVWALYSSNLRKYPDGLHPYAYLLAITLIGLGGILPLYLIELLALGKSMQLTPQSAASICYLAVFASVLAFIFWNQAVRAIGANRAGPFVHLMPVFSTILAVIFLDERVALYHAQGAGLIFLGIAVSSTGATRRSPEDRAG